MSGCGGGQDGADESASAVAAGASIAFTDLTASAGLAEFRHVTGAFGKEWFPETVGGGAGFLDFDRDGLPDIALVGGATWPGQDGPPVAAVRIYRNGGDGAFTDATAEAGLADLRAFGQGISISDYDNDGDPDILLTALGQNLLLRNDGGTFSDVSVAAGLGNESRWSTSAIFFDADVDGFVDLYVGNYVDWSPENDIWCTIDGETKAYCTPQQYDGAPGDFYHNNGDGTFANWTRQAGFATSPGKTLGVAEWDFNLDGWPDIVVANDTQRDLLYFNNGDGTFSERGVASGIAFDENGRSRAGMGIDIGVIGDSEMPAVVVGHFSNEMVGVYQQIAPGLFMDRAAQSQIGRPSLPTLTFGLLLTDVDLDGDLDLFTANGHIDEDAEHIQEGVTYRQYPQLFVNEGGGRFSDFGPAVGLRIVARSAASADYDRDGDEDLLVTENGGPVYLLRNDRSSGHSLRVVLEGRESNRDALGAYVTAVVGGRRIHRRVRTGSSFLASSDKGITIGLGDASAVDTLTVRWPAGRVEEFTNLPAGIEFRIVEGEGAKERLPLSAASKPS